MCMLSDVDIRQAIADGHIRLSAGFDLERHLKGASIDLTADVKTTWQHQDGHVLTLGADGTIFPAPTPQYAQTEWYRDRAILTLPPGAFALVRTRESLTLSDHLAARIDGRSSLARLGLNTVGAGHVNPGDEFRPMLEIANIGRLIVELHDGAPICSVAFWWLKTPASAPYRGRYYGVGAPVV